MSAESQPMELNVQSRREKVVVLPVSAVTVQKIGSLDEWKALHLNLKSLRPAVLKGQTLVVLASTCQP
jgi:hypothetical protein